MITINPALLASGLGSFGAKQIVAGIFKRFAKEWTIQGFKDAADNDYEITKMFEVSPDWSDHLRNALQRFKSLQKISANEVLSWVQDSNPILFNQICAEPTVIGWFYSHWEEGKRELLGMES